LAIERNSVSEIVAPGPVVFVYWLVSETLHSGFTEDALARVRIEGLTRILKIHLALSKRIGQLSAPALHSRHALRIDNAQLWRLGAKLTFNSQNDVGNFTMEQAQLIQAAASIAGGMAAAHYDKFAGLVASRITEIAETAVRIAKAIEIEARKQG